MGDDILERLVDFDRRLTATERYVMRKEAYDEIVRLRGLLKYATDTDEYRRLRSENGKLRKELGQRK